MTVTNSLAFSNMGQQIKVGGAAAIVTGNLIVGNCRAMSGVIPGTPSGYNARLDQFCRAGDTAILINASETKPAIFQNNTIYSANRIALEVEYQSDPSPKAVIKYDNNVFIGFPNSDKELPTPIYSNSDLKMFTNPGASFSNNTTYHAKSSWQCPATRLREVGGSCSDPHLKDEIWHPYGYGDYSNSKAVDKSTTQTKPSGSRGTPYASVAIVTMSATILGTGLWRGFRYLLDRGTKT
jgi:hypothetical protein